MKLNLGSNDTSIEDFINVDHRDLPNVDIVDDVFTLKTVMHDSCEEIVAAHILEHAAFDRTVDVLKRWYEILMSGGILWIAVPNFSTVINHHLKDYQQRKITWEYFNSRIFGRADISKKMYGNKEYEQALHKAVFDFKMMTDVLTQADFKQIKSIHHIPYRPAHPHEMAVKAIKE